MITDSMMTDVAVLDASHEAEDRRSSIVTGLVELARMLQADEIGFEWYSHDVQILLTKAGWNEYETEIEWQG